MNVMVLNPGSSSLKFRFVAARSEKDFDVLLKGSFDRIGSPDAKLNLPIGKLWNADISGLQSTDHAAELVLKSLGEQRIDAIAYRVVHGGDRFLKATLITPEVLSEISVLSELAPLHNPIAVECIRAGFRVRPDAKSVAVFDTSFHATMPDVARRYALPRDLADEHHLHRFGFHGISHRYVSSRLRKLLDQTNAPKGKLITCHLGNGASACAVLNGLSVDTSMGLTPLEGLVMGTRSGDIDPGLVLHLMRVLKMSVEEIDDLLNHRSGLKGLSGESSDVRDLEKAAASGDVLAEAALESFAYRCRKYIGAYAAAMGGIDAIAFAGGVGEHSAGVRSRIVRGLEFLGIHLDDRRNREALGDDDRPIGDGNVGVWVIPTQEEFQVAQETFELLDQGLSKHE